MSKSGVKRFLALYFLIFFGAVFLRIDYFPLSWVPMYGYRATTEGLTVKFGDLAVRRRGFFAQRATGETLYISAEHLNIPPGHFRRAYHQRAFNDGPPQDDRERLELSSFNRWWYEHVVGPDPRLKRRYSSELLASVNRTLGYGPRDPRRIVRLEASIDNAHYTRDQLARGDLTHPAVELQTAIITEQGSFTRRGNGAIERMPESFRANGAVD